MGAFSLPEEEDRLWRPQFQDLPDGFMEWFWRNITWCQDTHSLGHRLKMKYEKGEILTDSTLSWQVNMDEVVAEMVEEYLSEAGGES